MSKQVIPDDPGITDLEDDAPPPYRRRKTTARDWVAMGGALNAIFLTIGGIVMWAFGQLPFERTADHNKDIQLAQERMTRAEGGISSLTQSLGQIQRNGLLSLQLALQTRVDALSATLRAMAPNDRNFYAISVAHDEAMQQLDEVKRQLAR